MIPVAREPKALSNTGIYENCCFCGVPSPFWYEKNDVCVCKSCAEEKDEKDVPTKEEWFKQEKKLIELK